MPSVMPFEWIVPPFIAGGITAFLIWRQKQIHNAVGYLSPIIAMATFLAISWFGFHGPLFVAAVCAFLSSFSWLTFGSFLRQVSYFRSSRPS